MNSNSSRINQELSFFDIVAIVKKRWKSIVFVAILLIILTNLYEYFKSPPDNFFDAKVQVSLARYSDSEVLIDTPAFISAIKLTNFLNLEELRVCGYSEEINEQLFLSSLKLEIAPISPHILTISLRAKTKKDAENCMGAMLNKLNKIQQENIYRKKNILVKKINLEKKKIKDYDQLFKEFQMGGYESSNQFIGIKYLIASRVDRILDFEKELVELEELKAPELAAPIYVNSVLNKSNKRNFFLTSLMIGVFLGFCVAVIREIFESK